MGSDDLPGLAFIDAEVKASLAAQDRRSENLDTKAGLCLGFAGVLASVLLRAGIDTGLSEYVALLLDFAVAALSLLGYRVRSRPVLRPRQLRTYIDHDETSIKLAMLDTRVLVYEETNRDLGRKAVLVNAALAGLLFAVTATALAAGQSLGRSHIDAPVAAPHVQSTVAGGPS